MDTEAEPKRRRSLDLLALTAVAIALVAAPLNGATAQLPPGPGCHPSYWGWCVPIGVPDVDCIGGGGDGPYFVGRVLVRGPDQYRLDRDGNGIGCESSPTGPLWR